MKDENALALLPEKEMKHLLELLHDIRRSHGMKILLEDVERASRALDFLEPHKPLDAVADFIASNDEEEVNRADGD